jgi:protein subunit release factor B
MFRIFTLCGRVMHFPILRRMPYLNLVTSYSTTNNNSGNKTESISTPPAPSSQKEKKPYVKIELQESDLEFQFVKGSGPGGQKINKTSNCVLVKHIPTGTIVRCQQTRDVHANKGIALKILKEKLDDLINGNMSKNAKRGARDKKQKERRARKSKGKYGKEDDTDKNEQNVQD